MMAPFRAFQLSSVPIVTLLPSLMLATIISRKVWQAPPAWPNVSPAAVELHQMSR